MGAYEFGLTPTDGGMGGSAVAPEAPAGRVQTAAPAARRAPAA